MNTTKNLLTVVVLVVCCLIVIWFSTTTKGGPKIYEVQPRIAVPEYKSDTVHVIDAYERLMERYIQTTNKNSIRIDRELKEVIRKLDSIDDKLARLSLRIARIENTFGIEKSISPENKKNQSKASENKIPKEPFPIW